MPQMRLPGTGSHFSKFAHGGNVAVKTAVDGNDLTGKELAFIRGKIYAHIGNVCRAAIAVDHNVVKENVFKNVGHLCLVIRGNNKTGAHAVAADIAFAVLQGGGFGKHIHAGLCAGICGGTEVSAAGGH